MDAIILQDLACRLGSHLPVRLKQHVYLLFSADRVRHPGIRIRQNVIIILYTLPDLFIKPSQSDDTPSTIR